MRTNLCGLGLCVVLLAGAPVAAADGYPSLTLPGTPQLWAEVGGWRASRVERFRLLRDLVVLNHSNPAMGTQTDRQALEAMIQAFIEVERHLMAISKDGTVQLERARGAPSRAVDDLLTALGYELERRQTPVIKPRGGDAHARRREVLALAGVELEAFVARLVKEGTAHLSWPTFTVPLPLGFEVWTRDLIREPLTQTRLGLHLVSTRRWALLYVGLLGLDPQTLQTLASQPGWIAGIPDGRVATFATFSRSLHVREGQVLVPGGSAWVPLWESLVDRKVTTPTAFIDRILDTDDGRLAWFFDFAFRAAPAHRNWTLSAWETDERRRERRVRALYEMFYLAADAERFVVNQRPFARPTLDPAIIVSAVDVTPEGRMRGPASLRFWRDTLRSWDLPARVEAPLAARSEDDTFDAGALVDLVAAADPSDAIRDGRRGTSAVVLVQQFHARDAGASPASLASVARASVRFPMLVRTLDRVGADVTTAGRLIERARVLTDLGDAERFHLGVGQLQGALALVERAARIGGVSQRDVERLLTSLAAVPLDQDSRYLTGVLTWFRDAWAPVARAAAARDAGASEPSLEHDVLALLAGRVRGHVEAKVEWDGWDYQVNPAAARLRTLETVRLKHRSVTSELAMELLALDGAIGRITDAESARRLAADMRAIVTRLPELPAEPPLEGAPAVARVLGEAARDLEGIRSAGDVSRISNIRQRVGRVLEWVSLTLLRSLVYASAIRDAASPILLAQGVSQRHDLGAARDRREQRDQLAWSVPVARSGEGVPWHVEGSLLSLESAMSELLLRSAVDRAPTSAGRMFLGERDSLVRTVVAAQPDAQWGAEAAAAVRAQLHAGRDKVAAGQRPPLDQWDWRFSVADWSAESEPAGLASAVAMAELLVLDGASDARVHAFAVPLEEFTGSTRAGIPPAIVREGVIGHLGRGFLAALAFDVRLRVAELMAELHIPPILGPRLAADAIVEIVEQVTLGAPFDWLVMSRRISDYSAGELSALVDTLTGDGTLTAIEP